MLRLIAQISLVAGPLALLVFFQLQFLPYHHEAIPGGSASPSSPISRCCGCCGRRWRAARRRGSAGATFAAGKVAVVALASLVPFSFVFTIATFPGEWLDRNPVTVRVIPGGHRGALVQPA